MSSLLFSPLSIRDLNFRNRIFVSPMCMYSSQNGLPNSWHMVHLGSRAVGGAGLVMVEATGICPEGRISPQDTGLWNADQAQAFQPMVQFMKEHGAIPGIQLAHAGRKAETDDPALAPSTLAFSPKSKIPKAMLESECDQVVTQFVHSAKLALSAGFQVVEIHMAHGYLLHEFLSPLANQRTDSYGGSLENRMRLPLRVAESVRRLWPQDWPVFVRISATDWVEGGWDISQSLRLAKELQILGIDLIDCSSGGMTPDAKIPLTPGYQVPFAEVIRKEIGILTGAVGLITEPFQAEEILANGQADGIFIARASLRDPYWPLHAAKALGHDTEWPRQYLRGKS